MVGVPSLHPPRPRRCSFCGLVVALVLAAARVPQVPANGERGAACRRRPRRRGRRAALDRLASRRRPVRTRRSWMRYAARNAGPMQAYLPGYLADGAAKAIPPGATWATAVGAGFRELDRQAGVSVARPSDALPARVGTAIEGRLDRRLGGSAESGGPGEPRPGRAPAAGPAAAGRRRQGRAAVIADVLWLAVVNSLFLAGGLGVTGAAGLSGARYRNLAVSYLAGVASYGVIAQTLFVLGARMTRVEIVVVCAAARARARSATDRGTGARTPRFPDGDCSGRRRARRACGRSLVSAAVGIRRVDVLDTEGTCARRAGPPAGMVRAA